MACAVLEYGEGTPDAVRPGRFHGEEFSSWRSPEGRSLVVEWVKGTCRKRGGVGPSEWAKGAVGLHAY